MKRSKFSDFLRPKFSAAVDEQAAPPVAEPTPKATGKKKRPSPIAAQRLTQQQMEERAAQRKEQSARFRKGVLGFLDRFTGRKKQTEAQNRTEREALSHQQSKQQQDQQEQASAQQKHIQEKQAFIAKRRSVIETELKQDVSQLERSVQSSRDEDKEAFKRKRRSSGARPRRSRGRDDPKLEM